jgi:hypothetical protein
LPAPLPELANQLLKYSSLGYQPADRGSCLQISQQCSLDSAAIQMGVS